jgi:hypothetical protein
MLPNMAIRVSRKNTPLPTERGIYPPRSPFRSDSCRNIAITLIDFGGNQDSGCKLLKNRLRAARHQQKSSKIVL